MSMNGGAGQPVNLSDFINPNSMITPGAAGAFTMVITNTLCSQFAMLPGNWTALVVSFLFGALTFFYVAHLLIRLVYFVINSLIIFVMAHGSNAIGMSATKQAAASHAPSVVSMIYEPPTPVLMLAGLATTDPSTPSAAPGDRRRPMQLAQTTDKTDKKGFFRNWSWTPP